MPCVARGSWLSGCYESADRIDRSAMTGKEFRSPDTNFIDLRPEPSRYVSNVDAHDYGAERIVNGTGENVCIIQVRAYFAVFDGL